MPRNAKAALKKTSQYPYYEWTEEFDWEDDEFEDRKYGARAEKDSLDAFIEKITKEEGQDEIRFV